MPVTGAGAGPLGGLTVLEVGAVVAGPFAARMLGDLGAEVVKIEAPDKPDEMRGAGRSAADGPSFWWPVQARNKKLVTLDLRREAGQDLFLDMARQADVLVENLRPGTLERWHLGPDRLQEMNPRLIIARISGFGQTGPYARRASYAAIAEAMGGLRYINGYPGQPPPRTGISLGDSLAALFAVQGVLASLLEREASGLGQVVDVSLMESCFAMLESAVPEYDRLGLVRQPTGTGLGGVSPSNMFTDREGHWVVIGAHQDAVFRRLCIVMGAPELADDARFRTHPDRVRNSAELDSLIADWVACRDRDDVVARLSEAGVAVGPVYTIADIFADPQYRAREAMIMHHDEVVGDFMGPGLPVRLSRTPGKVRWSGPWTAGQHNREVLLRLPGMTEQRLAELADDGIV
jgi:formyl-CoA transferase